MPYHQRVAVACFCAAILVGIVTYGVIRHGTYPTPSPKPTPSPSIEVSVAPPNLTAQATAVCRQQVAKELGIVSRWGQFTLTHHQARWREQGFVVTPNKDYRFDCAMTYHGAGNWTVSTLDH